jgi:hypothetical protein
MGSYKAGEVLVQSTRVSRPNKRQQRACGYSCVARRKPMDMLTLMKSCPSAVFSFSITAKLLPHKTNSGRVDSGNDAQALVGYERDIFAGRQRRMVWAQSNLKGQNYQYQFIQVHIIFSDRDKPKCEVGGICDALSK